MHIHHRWLHYLGLGASSLCLVHCLLLPLVTPFLPFLRVHDNWTFEVVFVLLIALSTLTIFRGYQEHNEPKSLYLGSVGFILLVMSLFFEHNTVQIMLSVAGSFFMTLAHYINYKLCRVAPCCDHEH